MWRLMTYSKVYVWFAALVLASQGVSAVEPNVSDGVAMQGYDPVSYFQERPKKGESGLTETYDGVEYHFVNQANKEAFSANPGRYAPEYGGWCAYAMLEGDKVDVDPRRYKIINNKLYLFYDGFWGNTLEKWNEKAQKQSDEALVSKADAQWKALAE